MSPLLAFLFIFFTVQFVILHRRAGKRIRALEADLLDLEKAFNQQLDNAMAITEGVGRLADISNDHDKELIAIRAKLKMNEQEKPNEHRS